MAELMIYVKEHITDEGIIIAMCDESLIGKMLGEGKVIIDLDTYRDFYKGILISPDKYRKRGGKIISANIIGKEAVSAAIASMLIEKEHVKTIKGVPYAHAYHV